MAQRIPLVVGSAGIAQQLQSGDTLFGYTSVNNQTGTSYTVLYSDNGKLITFSNGTAVAVTLPAATGQFGIGFQVDFANRGTGAVTITTSSLLDGGTGSITLSTGQGIRFWSDGTNYYSQRGYSITGNQTITVTGDASGSGATGISLTISSNAVTYAKFQQVAASSIIGNPTGSVANAQAITLGSTLTFSGSALQTIAFTGDMTTSANSFATTVGKVNGVIYPSAPGTNTVPVVTSSNTITYEALPNAAMATMPLYTLKGNNTGSTASPADLTVAQVMTMLAAAPLASPAFTGTPTAPTVAITTNNTSIATTAAVTTAIAAAAYTLPAATISTLGGVIVGSGLSVTAGTISANVTSVNTRTGAVTTASSDITDATATGKALLTTSSVAAARITLAIDQRTTVADASYTMLVTDYNIQYTSLTASRTVTLVAASSKNAGQEITIGDSSGSCSATNTIIIQRNATPGTDTINGASSFTINVAYGQVTLQCDGTGKWIVVCQWNTVTSVNGLTGAVTGLATLASPAFTGTPTAPTVAITTNNTSIATTAAVTTALGSYVLSSLLGANSGVATLNSSGQLTTAQIPSALVGGLNYQGTWNASTNSPTLVSGTGTKGYMYKVSTAGSTLIDGNSNWNIGDMIIFDGTVWDRVAGSSENVSSVNGLTGAVTGLATLASPTFTGTPTAPTVAITTNNTSIATTAAVTTAIAAAAYTLPAATISTLGGVIIGTGLSVTAGTVSLAAGAASSNIGTLGGVLTGTLPNPGLASGSVTAAQSAVSLTSGEASASTNAGAPVYISAAGTFKRGVASAYTTASVIGLAVATIANGVSGYIATGGVLTLTTGQWDTVVTSESGGLTAGSIYFVDPTNTGNLTTVVPTTTGQVIMMVGRALSTTQMLIEITQPIQL